MSIAIETGRVENQVVSFSVGEEERAFLQGIVDDYNAQGNFETGAFLDRFEVYCGRRSLPLAVFWAVKKGVLVTKSLVNKKDVKLNEQRKKILSMVIAGMSDEEISKDDSLKLKKYYVRGHLEAIYANFAEQNLCRIAAIVASRKKQMSEVFAAIDQYLPTA